MLCSRSSEEYQLSIDKSVSHVEKIDYFLKKPLGNTVFTS
jgi:hypothetical protein